MEDPDQFAPRRIGGAPRLDVVQNPPPRLTDRPGAVGYPASRRTALDRTSSRIGWTGTTPGPTVQIGGAAAAVVEERSVRSRLMVNAGADRRRARSGSRKKSHVSNLGGARSGGRSSDRRSKAVASGGEKGGATARLPHGSLEDNTTRDDGPAGRGEAPQSTMPERSRHDPLDAARTRLRQSRVSSLDRLLRSRPFVSHPPVP